MPPFDDEKDHNAQDTKLGHQILALYAKAKGTEPTFMDKIEEFIFFSKEKQDTLQKTREALHSTSAQLTGAIIAEMDAYDDKYDGIVHKKEALEAMDHLIQTVSPNTPEEKQQWTNFCTSVKELIQSEPESPDGTILVYKGERPPITNPTPVTQHTFSPTPTPAAALPSHKRPPPSPDLSPAKRPAPTMRHP